MCKCFKKYCHEISLNETFYYNIKAQLTPIFSKPVVQNKTVYACTFSESLCRKATLDINPKGDETRKSLVVKKDRVKHEHAQPFSAPGNCFHCFQHLHLLVGCSRYSAPAPTPLLLTSIQKAGGKNFLMKLDLTYFTEFKMPLFIRQIIIYVSIRQNTN